MNNAILTIKSWNVENAKKLKEEDKKNNWEIFENNLGTKDYAEKLYNDLEEYNPRYIFVTHWSWMIPEKIWNKYETIVFHPTDLPYGRGGTPIQNLIVREIYKTKISAFKVNEGIDSGPIYLKKDFDISDGNVDDILSRASKIYFEEMIPEIVNKSIIPKPQEGEPFIFRRRKPEDGNLENILNDEKTTPKKIYDFIRMLDGEGYPRAYLECGKNKIEFYDARLYKEKVFSKSIVADK